MRVVVESIQDKGVHVQATEAAEWARRAAEGALDGPVVSVRVDLELTRQDVVVSVSGTVEIGCTRPCDRCGEDVALRIDSEVDLEYVPQEKGKGKEVEGELELADDDLDVGWYTGGELAMGDVLAEALALATPPRVMCADEAACEARIAALIAESTPASERNAHWLDALKRIR